MESLGWFQFLSGLQSMGPAATAWITCFPSSVVEPESLSAAKTDAELGGNGRGYLEMGWFPRQGGADLGEGVEAFLKRFKAKEVVYIRYVEPSRHR